MDNDQLSLAEKTVLLMTEILNWRPQIEDALQYGEHSYTFDDVVGQILVGNFHFYNYPECCLIMQVVQYPQFKNYHCFLAAGTQEALDAAGPDMERMGRQLGCRHLSISGRPGWERRLKVRGWKHVLSTMYLKISED